MKACVISFLAVQVVCGLRVPSAPEIEEDDDSHQATAFAHLVSANMNSSLDFSEFPSAPQEKPPWADIDVLMVSTNVNCQKALAINTLLTRLKPRQVFFITRSGECDKAEKEFKDIPPGKVRCMDEGSVFDGLSLRTVTEGFQALEDAGTCIHSRKDKSAAWFLQQFLKLGFAISPTLKEELSEHFLVWDSDMWITDTYNYHNEKGQVLYPTTKPDRGDRGYRRPSHRLLPGAKFLVSTVVHHMMMYKPYVGDLLKAFERADLPKGPALAAFISTSPLPRWAQNAMVVACVSHKLGYRSLGFSEYAFYASFVVHYHGNHAILGDEDQQKLERYAEFKVSVNNTCVSEEEFNRMAKKNYPGFLIVGQESHDSSRAKRRREKRVTAAVNSQF